MSGLIMIHACDAKGALWVCKNDSQSASESANCLYQSLRLPSLFFSMSGEATSRIHLVPSSMVLFL